MERKELLAALEAAKGPSRELDWEIAMRSGYFRKNGDAPEWVLHPSTMEAGEMSVMMTPWFTASLDAALTLAPEGWDAILYTSSPRNKELPQAELYTLEGKPRGIRQRAEGATLAIALCIAALRARGEG